MWIFFRKYNLPGLTLGGGKTVFILFFSESAGVVQSPKPEFDCLFDGLSELSPVLIKSLVDLRVGEVFPPVPYVILNIFNNNDRSLVSFSEDKELFLSLECVKCFMHSRPEVVFSWF